MRYLRYGLAILGVGAVLAVLAGIKGAQISSLIASAQAFEAAGPPPETVGTTKADRQAWEETLSAVGTAVSVKGVAVSSETAGSVARIHFESGQTVTAGQILVELDTSVERAQLAALRARIDYARTSLQRSRELAASGAIAADQLDADDANFRSMDSEARALQAQIARKVVRAPFAGKLGIRNVNLGEYLTPGTKIVDLESTGSLYVDFTLPQQNLAALALGMPVRATLGDRHEPVQGQISAIDSAVDASTRTVHVRATIPQQDEDLRPGVFVNVSVLLPKQPQVVAIPTTAVTHASFGDSVFVVDPSAARHTSDGKPIRTVQQRFVRLGAQRGDFVAVLDGLETGQEVVTAGAFKLRNDTPVVVDNSVQPNPKLAPRPTEG